jgi:5-methylcytosine-specific restriction endonuclease McrA
MCRGKNICSELGTDSNTWSKESPLPKPEWMNNEVDLFIRAVEAFKAGNKNLCLEIIGQIRTKEITEWYIEHGQMSGRHRKLQLNIPPPETIDIDLRDPVRSPAKLQKQVFERDSYHCRYCGGKLISQEFLKTFIKRLNSPLFSRGETNLNTHGIIHLTWPVADHVIPWNKGGRTSLDNLVSSCAPCNYGKDGYTIEQLGMDDPFERIAKNSSWDGFNENFIKTK